MSHSNVWTFVYILVYILLYILVYILVYIYLCWEATLSFTKLTLTKEIPYHTWMTATTMLFGRHYVRDCLIYFIYTSIVSIPSKSLSKLELQANKYTDWRFHYLLSCVGMRGVGILALNRLKLLMSSDKPSIPFLQHSVKSISAIIFENSFCWPNVVID